MNKEKLTPSPLTGKYLVKSPLRLAYLRFRDLFLKDCKSTQPIPTPKRILVCNLAHLGDVILSTVVLEPLKKAYPHAEIGFLVGSWSKIVVDGHHLIDNIHTLDHWKLNRSPLVRFEKVRIQRQSEIKALQEIKQLNYDLAIDLHPFFPNAIPFLSKTKIPYRIGYTSGGYGPSLTHSLDWKNRDQSVGDYHSDLLRLLSIECENPRPILPKLENTKPKLPFSFLEKGYLVFHMGAGYSLKEWQVEKWKELTKKCNQLGYKIVFTGKSEAENRNILEVTDGISDIVNLCDQVSWKEFVRVIQNASLLVCVDTAAGHVASCFELPTLVLFCGINKVQHWKPLNKNAIALIHSVPCSPCFRKNGCDQMSCIREISVENVVKEIQKRT